MRPPLGVGPLALIASACTFSGSPPRADQAEAAAVTYQRSAETAALDLPFSDAVRVGQMMYLSGQIGVKPGTKELVPGGLEAEARQAMLNIGEVLRKANAGYSDVVRCSVHLADITNWSAFNAVYVTYFPRHLPARSAAGVNGLALGARVEVECTAVIPAGG